MDWHPFTFQIGSQQRRGPGAIGARQGTHRMVCTRGTAAYQTVSRSCNHGPLVSSRRCPITLSLLRAALALGRGWGPIEALLFGGEPLCWLLAGLKAEYLVQQGVVLQMGLKAVGQQVPEGVELDNGGQGVHYQRVPVPQFDFGGGC